MRTFIFIFAFIFLLPISAQNKMLRKSKLPYLERFVAESTDSVVQGEPFTVEYILSSNGWKDAGRFTGRNGYNLIDLKYSKSDGKPYSQLMAKVVYSTSKTGNVELPRMSAIVGDSLVYSDVKRVYVKANPKYGKEMSLASDWLSRHVQHPDSLILKISKEDDNFWIFEDRSNDCFCIVAKHNIWDLLEQPIIAYSTESSMYYKPIVASYKEQISAMMKDTIDHLNDNETNTIPDKSITPLLDGVKWGQSAPYNISAPMLNGKKTLIGCVSLSIAMIMNYHKWPKQGNNHVFATPNDELFVVDWSKLSFNWDSYKGDYSEKDSAMFPRDLSKLFTCLGLSLGANYTEEITSAKYLYIKPMLCYNLGYSGKMNYYQRHLTDDDMISLIYRELDMKRPCILSDESHAFVCDGYNNEFFHVNLGWKGSHNGFYRLKLGNYPSQNKSLLAVNGILCGIEPQNDERIKNVVLKEAGTLETHFTSDDKEKITKLVISGPINSEDIKFLRKMAGAFQDNPLQSWQGGSLRILDLENAKILKDNEPYLVEVAKGGWTSVSYLERSGFKYDIDNKTYDFDTMNEKQWKSFKSRVGIKHEGLFYSKTEDEEILANYTCEKNTIGKYMFKDCSSLYSIILPSSLIKIDDFAFLGCVSLKSIRIPEKVKEVGKTPFSYCFSLEKIEVPRGFMTNSTLATKCSPVLSSVTHYKPE